ncbi:MAG: nucleoside kinase [Chloroflexi bacterium]|nr:nucleoside kinase [Chloroflexota bacterium]MBI3760239.1 nucleoside kinase [Chloroflexota bacterium]
MDTSDELTSVRPAAPRATAHVRLPDGREFEAPAGTPLEAFVRAASAASPATDAPAPILAAVVDGRLRELAYPVDKDISVMPVTMASEDGMRIYRRSLSFLMVAAARELFPEAKVEVDHSVYSGGYYCKAEGRAPFDERELKALEARMRELAQADLPITKSRMSLPEACEMFAAQGDDDKVRLLKHRRKDYLVVYSLQLSNACFRDYFHGYMAPSTGYLRWLGLQLADSGFVLRFPQRSAPTTIQPAAAHDRLYDAFREYGEWLDVLGIGDVGSLNDAVKAGRMREVILVSEALHEQRIAQIAAQIAARRSVRLVLIAGPSASGKTTFSKRLAIQLLANGLRPFPLAMDNYFVDRELTPRDEKGELDYESLTAVDVELFNAHLLALMAGESVELPRYNFKTGYREPGETVRLGREYVVVVEGIHGLNPALLPSIPAERLFRVYVSALTQLNLDRHNRVSTTDTRLTRRIVRDAATRGYSAEATLRRWESVRHGENKWIFPHQDNSDVMFNTALVYELPVLRPFAEPLLLQVRPESAEHIEARRLLAKLDWFETGADDELSATQLADAVPDNSILREFIGGSILRDFSLWGGK